MQARYKYPKLWNTWRGMNERCNNTHSKAYKNYGALGITVCTEWRNFNNFKEWAFSQNYVEGFTIDRYDSTLGYNPQNCRFISKYENTIRANKNRVGIKFKNLGKVKASKIINYLINTDLTYREIAQIFNTTISVITDINNCHTYKSLHNYKNNIRKEACND